MCVCVCVCVQRVKLIKIIFTISCNHCKNTANGSSRRPLGNLCYLQHNNNPYFTFKNWDCSNLFSICPLDPRSILLDPITHLRRLSMGHITQTPLSLDFPLGLATGGTDRRSKRGKRTNLGGMFFPSFFLWRGSDRGYIPLWN